VDREGEIDKAQEQGPGLAEDQIKDEAGRIQDPEVLDGGE
jgi:hypothetical protein